MNPLAVLGIAIGTALGLLSLTKEGAERAEEEAFWAEVRERFYD